MTRVVAGRWGGRRLRTPQGNATRPTSDRVRESMFQSIESMFGGLQGVRVVDVYAGSGALGIEALSRGAAACEFVESDRRAAAVIEGNLADLGTTGPVRRMPARRYARDFAAIHGDQAAPIELLLLDPPYRTEQRELMEVLGELGARMSTEALVVVERSSRDDFAWPEGIEAVRHRSYGETALWYGQPVPAAL